jgi:hypothetical protein
VAPRLAAALTTSEQHDLDTLEGIVQRGIDTLIEVGRALAEIRDRRLYRQTHGTFDEYCHNRWLLGRTRAYQLIDAAAVSTIVDKAELPAPANEAQSRELVPLKGDETEVVAAWREAKAEAEELGTPLTAKVVRNAIRKRLGRVKRERDRAEALERHLDSRCDGCGRTARELEQGGPGHGWFWSSRNGVRTHLCGDCNRESMRQDRERREREERELAERLGEEGYRQLQDERERDERRASATKELRYVRETLTGGEYGPEQSFILEVARWRDSLRELNHDDLDPDELRSLVEVVSLAEGLFAEIRAVLEAAS